MASRRLAITGALCCSQNIDGLLPQVLDPLRRNHNEGGCPVILHAAIEKTMKGLDNQPRRFIRFLGERLAVHDGTRIHLSMMIGGHRYCPERGAPDSMVLHEAIDLHRKHLRWRNHSVRVPGRSIARDCRISGQTGSSTKGTACNRAINDD